MQTIITPNSTQCTKQSTTNMPKTFLCVPHPYLTQSQLFFIILPQKSYILNSRILEESGKIERTLIIINRITKRQSIINKMNKNKANQSTQLKTSVIGVDLGSAFTKIAAVDKGVVDIITNEANLRQTPTIVGYGNNERLIGEAGNVKIKSNLNNTVIAPQRSLGVVSQEYLKEEGKHAPCQLKVFDGTLAYRVNCQGQETKICPQQAVAAFFTNVQQIMELNNINSKFLTVAVPSFLTQHERQAILDSLQISKNSLKQQFGIQLINQSAAVGLDYGFYKKGELPEKEEQAKNVLFVDFGHSKLSLYVIKFTKNYQKVVFQSHLRQTGCKNLDEQMLKFYSQLFEKNNPNLDLSISQSKKATIKLLENIEKQRKILSGNSEYDFNIDCLLEQCDISYTMKREQFEAIIHPVIYQIRQFFLKCAQELKQRNISIASIQLIGGGSRIPLFIRTVSKAFGMETQRTLNSSECIARGASLSSAMNSGFFKVQGYYSVELSPETLVCGWRGEAEEMQDQKNQIVLYGQNETLFSKKVLEWNLKDLNDYKSPLLFTITTKNTLVDNSRPVCSFKLSLREGKQERKLKIIFEINNNSMISKVSAFESNQEVETPLKVNQLQFYKHLSQAKIAQFSKIEREQMIKDIGILKQYENKNKFESSVYELKEKLTNSTKNAEWKYFINPKAYNELLEYFSQIQNQFESIQNFEQALTEINEKVRLFHDEVQQSKKRQMQVEKELQKLSEFIDNVVEGKIKKIRFYPKQSIQNTKKWIKDIRDQQKTKKKHQGEVITVEQIAKVTQDLKQSIRKCEQEMVRNQKQASYRPTYEQRQYQNDPSSFDPFGKSYPRYDTRNRGRGRNTSFKGHNSGLFSGFPNFF